MERCQYVYDPYDVRPVFVLILHLFICIFAICVQFIHILTFAHRHSIYLWTILIISDPSTCTGTVLSLLFSFFFIYI
jgi:hypothetical protein